MIGTVMLPVGDWSLWGLMANYLPVLIAAWLATMIATPIVRAIAISTNVVDSPDEARKIHKKPIAYLGGVAVFIGLIVGIAVSYTIASPISFRPVPISVVVAMMAITVTGFIDDVWGLDPWFKTIGLLVAAGLMSLYGGIGTQTAAGFLAYFTGNGQVGFDVSVFGEAWHINITEWVGVGIVAVFVLGGCNASNLIDGLDGLLSGTTMIIAGGLLLISLLMTLHLTTADLDLMESTLTERIVDFEGITLAGARTSLCMALIGVTLAFLVYNFNPAKIFLGDTGSLLLGYCCVTIVLMLGEMGQTHFVLAGLIVFGLPIVDTVLAIFRRKAQGLPASAPDANHLHHILKRWLGTIKLAVIGMWSIEAVLASIGVALAALSLTHELRVMVIYIVFLMLFGGVAIVGALMGRRALRAKRGQQ